MTAVTVGNLTKTYPGRSQPVLEQFSLEVACGDLVALLGSSGAGKSTLLKLIAGIERPDTGDISFDGKSILNVPAHQREAVLMFQKAYLFPFLSVGENIGFGLKVKRMSESARKAEVSRMLRLIGLPGIEHRRPSELSGGEQQRVALARALVTHPKVLLLDEPFNSLDTPVRLELQEAVRNLQNELGITTILVTHDLDEAMAMSDRMALLMQGQVKAYERPNVLFQCPPCVASAKFVGVTTFLEGDARDGWLISEMGPIRIPDPKKTGRGVYAIRPEKIAVQTDPCEYTLPGMVLNSVFRGEYVEYQIAIQQMNVRARVSSGEQKASRGDKVYVEFPPEHLFEVRN